MFVLPLVVFPLVLAVAAHRLFTVPRRVLAGTLQLAHGRRSLMTVLTVIAYFGLLAYTVGLVLLLARTVVESPSSLSAWWSVAPVFAGYPVAWVAAEWVFYHGFRRPPKQAREST
ncbi:hypothetical protein [Ideonella sp. A 288]|uniref:hypothetical protein n=1 Tax=Ideonella sp. A 288 TaxID=1962181 RepID=UPI000B4B3148|nr:hypothetical protein [Ideonella sp. A 288]